ncbi:MAG: hypothetical protein AB8B96_02200 [Lysobacterales bacterium]
MNLFPALNPVLGISGLMALALSANMAFAEVRETLKIKVSTDDGISESVTIENLAVGASEVYTTESGNEVLVTRFDDGLELEVDGRVIDVKLPDVSAHSEARHGKRIFLSDSESLLDGSDVWIDNDGGEVRVTSNRAAEVVVIGADGDSLSEEELEALIHEHVEEMSIDVDTEHSDGHEVIIIKKKVISIEDGAGN